MRRRPAPGLASPRREPGRGPPPAGEHRLPKASRSSPRRGARSASWHALPAGWPTRLARDLEPGDRVVLLAGNDVTFVQAYLAILTAGAVAVPLNAASPSHELAHEIGVVDPQLVITEPAFADLARRACGQHAEALTVLVYDASGDNELAAEPLAPVERAPEDLAVLLFTAGTAGAPKPAMLTHGSLLANLEQMQAHPGLRVGPGDVALAVLPFFHVFGLNVVLGLSLMAGAAVTLVDHFHPTETLHRVRADGVTVIAVVPAVLEAWNALDATAAPADALARCPVVRVGRGPAAGRPRRRDARTLRRRRARRLRADRGVARRHDQRGRRQAARRDRSARPCRASRCAWSTPRATTCSPAIPARSSCGDRTCSPATGTTPTRPHACSVPMAGCTPATSVWPTTTAGSRWSSAPRTS